MYEHVHRHDRAITYGVLRDRTSLVLSCVLIPTLVLVAHIELHT